MVTPPAPPTQQEAARFLTQATFGGTESDINALHASTYAAWLSAQTSAPVSTPTHVAWADQRLTQLQAASPSAVLTPNQFYESFWEQAATSPDQLRQRVKFALSQIFVVSLIGSAVDPRGAASYYDMLGADAFGNFRTLLTDVTYHPMMGVYLTYVANTKESGTRTPDQNYARELMQLMTIGLYKLNPDGSQQLDGSGKPIPTYSQNDILGLAKVFTGLGWYSPAPTSLTFRGANKDPDASIKPMLVYNQYHSTSEKDFLGVTIPATTTADTAGDIKIALDTLFNHPSVGPFIALHLIQQLVTSNPSPAYIQRVAAVFNNNGSGVRGDMAAVVTAILTDTEARDMTNVTAPGFGKLREPVVRLANWMRMFSATSFSGNWLMFSTAANTSLGEAPLSLFVGVQFLAAGLCPAQHAIVGARTCGAGIPGRGRSHGRRISQHHPGRGRERHRDRSDGIDLAGHQIGLHRGNRRRRECRSAGGPHESAAALWADVPPPCGSACWTRSTISPSPVPAPPRPRSTRPFSPARRSRCS